MKAHGFETDGLCVLYMLSVFGQVSRDRLHSLGIKNAAQAVNDAEAKAQQLGHPIHVSPPTRDGLTNDVIYIVTGTPPPIPLPLGLWTPNDFDHNSREYVDKLKHYECRTCGRQPRYLPHVEADGILRGYCPEHGLTAFRMIDPRGAKPLARERSKFDIDLRRATIIENTLAALIINSGSYKLEMKHDLQAYRTGNVFIETQRERYGSSETEPSGLSITQADLYIQSLDRRADVYILSVPRLKEYVVDKPQRRGGDGMRSLGVLIPIDHLRSLYPDDLWDSAVGQSTDRVLTTA